MVHYPMKLLVALYFLGDRDQCENLYTILKKESKLNKLKLMVLFKTITYWYTNSCNIILGSVV